MNVAGHITVALRLYPDDPSIWLGAALPDLAAMGRHRLLGTTADAAVERGIALHHRTDDAFHRHDLFTGPMARLRSELAVDGVGRGPARAVAHVGPELLLDGELLSESVIVDAVAAAFELLVVLPDSTLGSLVAGESEEAWLAHLRKIPAWGLPTDYADPAAVAGRLHRILERRPRLAFDHALVPAISDRLAFEQPSITSTSDRLLSDLVAELS